MFKRILSFVLLLTMMLSLCPVYADAAVGDLASNPVMVSFGTQYSRSWTSSTDHLFCYNQITMAKDGLLKMTFSKPYDAEGEYGRLDVVLYDEEYNLVWDSESYYSVELPSPNYTFHVGLPAGTYYLNLKPGFTVVSGNITTRYSFSYTDTPCELEPNGSASTATPMELGVAYTGYYGRDGGSADSEDWYSVYLTSGLKTQIQIGNYGRLDATTCIIGMSDPNSDSVSMSFNKVDEEGETCAEFTPSQTGTYRIRLYNYRKEQFKYTIKCTQKEPLVLKAPSLVISNNNGKPQLEWTAVDGAAKYHVYIATSKNGTYKLATTGTGTSVVHSSAEPGKTYYYKVRAVASDGTLSPYSNVAIGFGLVTELEAPVVTISSSDGIPLLLWDAVPDAVKYEVHAATSKTGTYTLKTTVTNTSAIHESAELGKTYYYKVKAVAEDGTKSEFSNVVSMTCRLGQPKVSITGNSSSGKPVVKWETVEGAEKYYIYRATSRSGSYKRVKSAISARSYTDTTAKAGTNYYYKVKAIHEDSDANSEYSEIVNRMCDLKRPSVSISRNSSGKPYLKWKDISGAKKYYVYRATSEDGEYKYLGSTTSEKYSDKKASRGKTYYYKVKAIHSKSSANSAYSAVKSIKSK